MNRWKEGIVRPDSSILEAIQAVERQSVRAAFVVDDDGKLLGIVTDGDIRRGLIAGVELSREVGEVMNKNPLTCAPNDSNESVRRIMEAKDLLQMPVVEDGRLTNVLTLEELTKKPRIDNPVFLMAGGYGTRLQPLTDQCPKPLLKVGSQPILETIIENFAEAGFHNFYISTHYLPEMIKEYFGDGSRWGINIEYTYEEQPLGTAGALGLLPDSMPKLPLIMMNGDILTKVNFGSLLDYHLKSESAATMCVREHEYQVPYGVVQAEDFQVQSMTEKPVYRYYINAGIYVINPEVIECVEANTNLDMPALLSQHVEKGGVSMFPLDEYWLDIGRMNDFERAQQDIQSIVL
ncbi:MAG: nucleotidyltransferase family protein [Cellvibrionaceae bacterium]